MGALIHRGSESGLSLPIISPESRPFSLVRHPALPMSHRSVAQLSVAILSFAVAANAQGVDSTHRVSPTPACASCAEWNAPHAPVHIYGNTYWVGTNGLGSILITSPGGHVLIDGALAESPEHILENIRALGFRIQDVKLILNSHVHYDHAGGIAELQRLSGAIVAASPWSAAVLRSGNPARDDPQYGIALPIAPVSNVRAIHDGETLRVGPLAVMAHFTPGHTPGGTTWTWQSCEARRCNTMVYADSQTPVSADDFLFTRNTTYPSALADFRRSASVLDTLRCDILITPHPGASAFWERVAARDSGNADALMNHEACRAFAEQTRKQLAARIAKEGSR